MSGGVEPGDRHAQHWADAWQAAWEALDVEAVVALYAADATFSSQPFRTQYIGPDGVREYVTRAFGEEADVRAWMGRPVVDGDRAAVEWWATLWEAGEEITLAGTSVLRFGPDGLVRSQHDTWNQSPGRREPPPGWGGTGA